MLKIKYILPLFLLVLLFGCEKVIDVDLNEVSPNIVIEANLIGRPGAVEVKITKTGDYFGTSPLENVSGATVVLDDDAGNHFELPEIEEGIYGREKLHPVPGRTYTLTVEVEGEEYVASSTLHPAVEITSLDYFYEEGQSYFDDGYYLILILQDPADEENYYRIKTWKNGRSKNDAGNLILFTDRYVEGKEVQITMRGTVFKNGSIARVQLISLDKGAFEFYRTFDEVASTNPGSAAPANPKSNFSNGALGFFSAWSFDEKEIIINEK